MAAIEEAAGSRLDCSPFLAVMGRSFFKGGASRFPWRESTSDPLTSRSVEEPLRAAAAAAAADSPTPPPGIEEPELGFLLICAPQSHSSAWSLVIALERVGSIFAQVGRGL